MKYLHLTIILSAGIFFSCSYMPDEKLTNPTFKNQMNETAETIVLKSGIVNPEKALLFYPGGLVDPHVYLKWQDSLVTINPDLMIITVKMPSNLAVLDIRKGLTIMKKYPEINKWLTGGHSLGGTMAAEIVAKEPVEFKALIFIASYPASDVLKNWNGAVLSIAAEKDGLSTAEDISNSKINLPAAYTLENEIDFQLPLTGKTHFYEIKGGNHAGFGNYGAQDGDGIATITSELQQKKMVEVISGFISKL